MIQKNYKVTTDEGLHARPSSLLVAAVSPFTADVKLVYGEKSINMKSIMGVMALGISVGSDITIIADGVDEAELMAKVDEVMKEQGIAQS
ncbi:HPr family phosphocarrier protein [Sporosarcina sp. NPDC096371]|uniref:HPr family phosphocarrier protein n=1 Tax=Sporosarcina sp. NPDC096371 TaxID=3364530 RepID=UPI003826AD7F